jgi:hypothetical protein
MSCLAENVGPDAIISADISLLNGIEFVSRDVE